MGLEVPRTKEDRLLAKREAKVVKANDLTRARFDLSVVEQKIIAYLLSKVKRTDTIDTVFHFSVKEFCEMCGISARNGNTYRYIRNTLKGLHDKSIIVRVENEGVAKEFLFSWIDTYEMYEKSGDIDVVFSRSLEPFLFELKENFTSYKVKYALQMKSQYGLRLYEIFKSYQYRREPITFDIAELKYKLCVEGKYDDNFAQFRRNVLEVAVNEINAYTDIHVDWTPQKEGRLVV